MKSDRRDFIQRLGVDAGLRLVSPKVFGSFSAPAVKAIKTKQVLFVGDNITLTYTIGYFRGQKCEMQIMESFKLNKT